MTASALLVTLVLAAGTFAFKATGPTLEGRLRPPRLVGELLGDAATVMLVALAATNGFTRDGGFGGWARAIGVVLAGVLALTRVPFPVVVVGAAACTAALRLLGVP